MLIAKAAKMTILTRSMTFPLSRPFRCTSVAALLTALIAGAGAAEARGGAGYDGTWNVIFATRIGTCSAATSVPFTVSGRRVSSAGGGKVTGGVGRNGRVAVAIRVGLSHASGVGRLAGNVGTGRWSGVISGDRCSGSWQARRS
jgi:hypothetical protein